MEQQVDLGHTRNIGVSNFNISQLEKVASAAKIYPATLQVELHAYLQQPELCACCAKLGIPITAYSPLGSPGAKLHFQQKYNFHYLWVDMLTWCVFVYASSMIWGEKTN